MKLIGWYNHLQEEIGIYLKIISYLVSYFMVKSVATLIHGILENII